MSNVELRSLEPSDRYAHQLLMSHAFGRGAVVAPPLPSEPLDAVNEAAKSRERTQVGVFEDGQLRAALTTCHFAVHWPGATGESAILAMGGIAGVATFADARGRGFIDMLLRDSLVRMRAAGEVVSALYPFAWAFYRRFGWDWVGEKREIVLPLRELRASPEGKQVTTLTLEDAATIAALSDPYTKAMRRYRGAFTAESHQWTSKLAHSDGHTTGVYTYADDGYLLWRFDRGASSGEIREFVAGTPEAYRGLLSLLHYFGTQCETARVSQPGDTVLGSFLTHWEVKARVAPVFAGRVVDVAAAMERCKPTPDLPQGSVVIALRDEHAPWNDGLFRISYEGGESLQCQPVDAGEAAVTLDISIFSQAFWGLPSLLDLRRAGRVTVADEAGFRWLCAVLPPTPIWTEDGF